MGRATTDRGHLACPGDIEWQHELTVDHPPALAARDDRGDHIGWTSLGADVPDPHACGGVDPELVAGLRERHPFDLGLDDAENGAVFATDDHVGGCEIECFGVARIDRHGHLALRIVGVGRDVLLHQRLRVEVVVHERVRSDPVDGVPAVGETGDQR